MRANDADGSSADPGNLHLPACSINAGELRSGEEAAKKGSHERMAQPPGSPQPATLSRPAVNNMVGAERKFLLLALYKCLMYIPPASRRKPALQQVHMRTSQYFSYDH